MSGQSTLVLDRINRGSDVRAEVEHLVWNQSKPDGRCPDASVLDNTFDGHRSTTELSLTVREHDAQVKGERFSLADQ